VKNSMKILTKKKKDDKEGVDDDVVDIRAATKDESCSGGT